MQGGKGSKLKDEIRLSRNKQTEKAGNNAFFSLFAL
jgi:hypothetical protein